MTMVRKAAADDDVLNRPRKRVLVADCHEEVLIALEKLLEDAGFDTTIVWTAADVLKQLDLQTFDLVLVNECLPDAECENLLKALRKKGSQVPCIVMQPSAPEITDFADLQALGARGVVCKYAYRQVVGLVSKWLSCDKKTAVFV